MTDPHRQRPIKSILLPILSGLAAAQVLGTLFVRQSNLALLAKVETLAAAGWFTIPTGPAVKPLAAMAPALLGGLFYTLSAGAGLILLTWALLFIYNKVVGVNRTYLCAMLVLWMGLLVLVNSNGLILYPTLFVLVVPTATALLMVQSKSSLLNIEKRSGPRWLPLIILILLTVIWATQLMTSKSRQNLFISIRDNLILSNPVGEGVNNFYYRYTLYAAEAFKAFDQKTIRSCVLEGFPEDNSRTRLESLLSRWDILVVADAQMPDLRLLQSSDDLILASPRGEKTVVGKTDFFNNPKPSFAAFSSASDRYGGFRRKFGFRFLILVGLLIGFPCLLYAMVYTLAHTLLGLFLNDRRAMQLSSILCLLIGVGLFLPILRGHLPSIEQGRLAQSLANSAWPERVAALRFIETQKLEIADYPSYRNLLHSPMVVERYWLARAFAVSRDPETYSDLLAMMEDPHPNVICQAYYALGQRHHPAAVKTILNNMRTSSHWYTQWYGYRAIRRLGWQQTTSKPIP